MKTCTITGCKQEAQLFCDLASETVKFKMPNGPLGNLLIYGRG